MLRLILRRVMSSRVVLVGYVVVGLLVANSHHYFAHLSSAKSVGSALLGMKRKNKKKYRKKERL